MDEAQGAGQVAPVLAAQGRNSQGVPLDVDRRVQPGDRVLAVEQRQTGAQLEVEPRGAAEDE